MAKRVLAERGLMIKLSELYELIQDDMDDNFIDFVRSIILEPGLRIAEGDEFLVHQVGNTLMVKAGGVVFPNYDIFVPSDNITDMSIDLKEVTGINEPETRFIIYLTLTTDVTHPQKQIGASKAFWTIRQNAVKVLLVADNIAPPSNSYLLGTATVQTDGSLKLEDRRMESILKLVSKYACEDWESISIPTQVEGVEAKFIVLEDFRHGGTGGYSFNKKSIPINRRIGPALEVTWQAPSQEELDAINGVVYYKVVATPEIGDTSIPSACVEQIVIVDRIGIGAKLPDNRIGCVMLCDLGTYYSVVVYRISDILDMEISSASDEVMIKAGTGTYLMEEDLSVSLEYTLNSTDFIKISSSVAPTSNTVIRVFVYEYTSPAPDNIEDLKYLIYEGTAKDVIHRVQDKTKDGVTVLYQVRGKNSQLFESIQEGMEFENVGSQMEHLVYFCVPESKDGWPGRDLPSTSVAGAAVVADKTDAVITVPSGHNRQVEDWIYIINCTNPPNIPNGAYEITKTTETTITIDISGAPGPPAGVGTCDIAGNAIVQNVTNPAKLTIPASSHLQGLFSNGNYAVIGNTTIVGTLPNGTYEVVSIDTSNEIHLDDNTGPAGAGHCDVVAPETITLLEFTMEDDVILSRIKVSGYQGQVLHTTTSEHGNIARYIVNSAAAGDQYIDVPRSGGGYKEFEASDPILAGATITLKLTRGSNNLVGINASAYHVFLYFNKAL